MNINNDLIKLAALAGIFLYGSLLSQNALTDLNGKDLRINKPMSIIAREDQSTDQCAVSACRTVASAEGSLK